MPQMRPEARPVGWQALDRAQQGAISRILATIDEAVSEIPTKPSPEESVRDTVPWLDYGRSNRACFLSGGRGTGKSTVLLSACRACQNPALLGPGAPADVQAHVQRIQSRVVWLEPIDMEPLPPASNLLAAILARVSRVVQELQPGRPDSRDNERGLLEPSPDYQSALAKLHELRANVSAAWDGNIRDRKGSLDADAFAIEVMRSEEARLLLNKNIQMVLDGLAFRAFRGTNLVSPMFVLPVDDFDLNPAACLDLLRLLRTIWAPRLFFLVLGDVRIAELIVNLKMSSDLADVHGNVDLREVSPQLADEVAKIAGEVSANAVRKLMPPGQRIWLPPMTRYEAFVFRPFGDETLPRLDEFLQHCPVLVVPVPAIGNEVLRKVSLRDFLLRPGQAAVKDSRTSTSTPADQIDLTEASIKKTPYSALSFLKTTPRRVSDLWMGLQRIVPHHIERALTELDVAFSQEFIEFLAGYCQAILSEEPALSPENRRAVPNSFRPTPSGRWDLTQLPIYVESLSGRSHIYDVAHTSANKDYDLRFQFGPGAGWRFNVDPEARYAVRTSPNDEHGGLSAKTQGSYREISEETSGALMLFHDLLALGPDSRQLDSHLVHWDIGDPWAVVKWSDGPYRCMQMRWPPPPGTSFYEFDHFIHLWRDALDHVTKSPLEGTELACAAAFHWINAGTAILDGEPPVEVKPIPTVANWKRLHSRLEKLLAVITDPQSPVDKASAWLADIAVLTMPERGLPRDVYRTIAPKDSDLWEFWHDEIWRIIRHRRGVRLAEMHAAGLSDLAEAFRVDGEIHKRLRPTAKFVERLTAEFRERPGVTRRFDETEGEELETSELANEEKAVKTPSRVK